MDEGKDSLGTAGARNADAFDTPVQPPTHPTNSLVSPDSTANNKIISSANLTPPTPLSAPLPTDPLHPIQTVGSGEGDVVVGRKSHKDKKLALIIIVIVALLLIGSIILAIVFGSKASRSDLAEAFGQYYNLIENGPEGYDPNSGIDASVDAAADQANSEEAQNIANLDGIMIEEEITTNERVDANSGYVGYNPTTNQPIYVDWFLFKLDESNLSDAEKQAYIDAATAEFNNFDKLTKRAKSDIKTELEASTQNYAATLSLYTDLLTLDLISDKLTNTFIKDGTEAAAKYINQVLAEETKDTMLKTVHDFIEKDLQSELSALEMYAANNCLNNGSVDPECAENLSARDADFAKLLAQQNLNYQSLIQMSTPLKINFYNQTTKILKLLGGQSAQ